jgi:hypothetical protein
MIGFMPIEPVKIPQNVYVEDTIIGPITFRQLIIVGIGAGISYVIFAMVTQAGFTDVTIQGLCWLPALIAAAFAFIKINDLSLTTIILLSIEIMNKPNVRYFSPHGGISINLITRQTKELLEQANKKATIGEERLIEITEQLKKRQEEMSHLSGNENQTPENTHAVRTTMKDIIAPSEEEKGNSLPVISQNSKTEGGLVAAKSIDTIQSRIHTIQQFSL